MAVLLRKLIFDTSAVNKLAADLDRARSSRHWVCYIASESLRQPFPRLKRYRAGGELRLVRASNCRESNEWGRGVLLRTKKSEGGLRRPPSETECRSEVECVPVRLTNGRMCRDSGVDRQRTSIGHFDDLPTLWPCGASIGTLLGVEDIPLSVRFPLYKPVKNLGRGTRMAPISLGDDAEPSKD